MTTFAIDGAVVSKEAATVSVLDHGLLYGDGVFEGLCLVGGRIFRLSLHLRRLHIGLAALGLDIRGGRSRIVETLAAACDAHDARDGYVRLVVTRGEGALGVDPSTCERPRVIAIVGAIQLYASSPGPASTLPPGISLATSSLRRPAADVLDPRVKSLNYLNNVLAKREAKRCGADEALLLNAAGNIAEASAANLFIVREGVVSTPPTADGALDGITRRSVLELCARLGLRAEERSLGRVDLLGADEAFLSGTGAGLVPVGSLDGAAIGMGDRPVLARIAAVFESARSEWAEPIAG